MYQIKERNKEMIIILIVEIILATGLLGCSTYMLICELTGVNDARRRRKYEAALGPVSDEKWRRLTSS